MFKGHVHYYFHSPFNSYYDHNVQYFLTDLKAAAEHGINKFVNGTNRKFFYNG